MRLLPRPKVWLAIVLGACTILGAIGSGFYLWDRNTDPESHLPAASSIPSPTTLPTPTVTPTPTIAPIPTPEPSATPVPPLDKQLAEALSVESYAKRGEALLIVAQHAVLELHYETAITAASAIPSSSVQSKALSFVVSCAIEDGLFNFAAEAASQIESYASRDTQKIRVIEARKRVSSDAEPFLSEVTRFYRSSMACFNDLR